MSPWNLVPIPNLVTWLIQLSVCGTKRTNNRCLWLKPILVTWHETWTFPRNLPNSWVLIFERIIYWYLEQHYIGIRNARKNLDIYSRLMKYLHWSTVTILLTDWITCSEVWCYGMETFHWPISQKSKGVLLNYGNKFSSIPVGYSVKMKESQSMERLLSALNYQEQKWLICWDITVVGLILWLEGGYTVYPYFLCLWHSRANDQNYVRQEWLPRQRLKPGSHNILSHHLVEPSKMLVPRLHIKLGVMMKFVTVFFLSSIRRFN